MLIIVCVLHKIRIHQMLILLRSQITLHLIDREKWACFFSLIAALCLDKWCTMSVWHWRNGTQPTPSFIVLCFLYTLT